MSNCQKKFIDFKTGQKKSFRPKWGFSNTQVASAAYFQKAFS